MATTETVELFNVFMRRVRRIGVREYRTPRSKHTFSQHDHLCVLVFKTITKASLRTVEMLAPLLLGRHMDHSTPQKAQQRLGMRMLTRLLTACLPSVRGKVFAIDSTGFSTNQRSPYYTNKFFAEKPSRFVKVSLLVDTRTIAVLAARIHVLPRHDVRDAGPLVQHARGAKHLVADKAYDAEWLHELLEEINVLPHIPARRWSRRGFWRKRHLHQFRLSIYRKRSLVETTNSVVKRRWGGSVAARKVVSIRAEILLKLIVHNLMLRINSIFYCMISTGLCSGKC